MSYGPITDTVVNFLFAAGFLIIAFGWTFCMGERSERERAKKKAAERLRIEEEGKQAAKISDLDFRLTALEEAAKKDRKR